MEHRYAISVLDENIACNEYTYEVTTIDLYEKTISLMKLVREAIIYLSFAMHIEKRRKKEEAVAQGRTLSELKTSVMPDQCK